MSLSEQAQVVGGRYLPPGKGWRRLQWIVSQHTTRTLFHFKHTSSSNMHTHTHAHILSLSHTHTQKMGKRELLVLPIKLMLKYFPHRYNLRIDHKEERNAVSLPLNFQLQIICWNDDITYRLVKCERCVKQSKCRNVIVVIKWTFFAIAIFVVIVGKTRKNF